MYMRECISLAAIAKETKEVVQKEEQEATVKAQKTQEIADSAQRDLDEALPALVCTWNPLCAHVYDVWHSTCTCEYRSSH